jgi:hypothetical protein
MRQLLIDDLSREEQANIENYLKRTVKQGGIAGMYWLAVPDDLLGAAQQDHQECGPFHFGIELAEYSVTFELLVRSESNLHCTCISYATDAQREFLLKFVDRMISEEQIKA